MSIIGDAINYVLSKLPTQFALPIVILIIFFYIIRFFYKEEIVQLEEKTDLFARSHRISVIVLLIIIILIGTSLYFANENGLLSKTPQNHFRVLISPFYLEDSTENDHTTAENIKNEIINASGNRIEVEILNSSPIKYKEDAIQEGRKAGAHLVVYGGEKRILGHKTQIEFNIISTNSKLMIPDEVYPRNKGTLEFNLTYNKYLDIPITILEDNVSSAVEVICAYGYYEKSEYDSALETFKNIKDYDKNGAILFYIASCYRFEGELNKSLVHYDKVTKLDPQYLDAWICKGCVLGVLGNYKEANDALNEAINLDPKNSIAWNDKGAALFELGNYTEAIDAYNRALEFNPQYSDAWVNKGNTFFYLKNYTEAVISYDKAIELGPKNSNVWSYKGDALFTLGNYTEAIDAYNKALELNPQSENAWSNKGVAFHNLKNYTGAMISYNKAIELNPKDSNAWYNKGCVLGTLGNYAEAIDAFNKAIELDPKDSNTWYSKGLALSKLGNYTEADDAYKKAFELDPKAFKFDPKNQSYVHVDSYTRFQLT